MLFLRIRNCYLNKNFQFCTYIITLKERVENVPVNADIIIQIFNFHELFCILHNFSFIHKLCYIISETLSVSKKSVKLFNIPFNLCLFYFVYLFICLFFFNEIILFVYKKVLNNNDVNMHKNYVLYLSVTHWCIK